MAAGASGAMPLRVSISLHGEGGLGGVDGNLPQGRRRPERVVAGAVDVHHRNGGGLVAGRGELAAVVLGLLRVERLADGGEATELGRPGPS